MAIFANAACNVLGKSNLCCSAIINSKSFQQRRFGDANSFILLSLTILASTADQEANLSGNLNNGTFQAAVRAANVSRGLADANIKSTSAIPSSLDCGGAFKSNVIVSMKNFDTNLGLSNIDLAEKISDAACPMLVRGGRALPKLCCRSGFF